MALVIRLVPLIVNNKCARITVVSSFGKQLVHIYRIAKEAGRWEQRDEDEKSAWASLISDGATRGGLSTCESRGASIKMRSKGAKEVQERGRGEETIEKWDPVNCPRCKRPHDRARLRQELAAALATHMQRDTWYIETRRLDSHSIA